MAAEGARVRGAASPEYEALSRIFDDAKAGTWEWNASSGVMRWSERFEAQHGFQSGGLGTSLESHLDRVHVDDRSRVRDAFLAIASSGQPLSLDYHIVAPDGRAHPIACEARISDGSPRVIGLCRDLSQSVQRYMTLAQAMPAHVFTATPDGTFDFVNDFARDYFGLTGASSADFWPAVVHPDDVQNVQQQWKRSISTGENYEVEMRLRASDGEYHWHVSRAVPVRDASGSIVQWIGSAMDIDARQRLFALMTAQSEIAQLLVDAKSLDEVAAPLLETYCRNLHWQCAQLWVPDAAAGVIRQVAGWHDAKVRESDWSEFSAVRELQRGRGVAGRVWESKSPLWIEEVHLDPAMPRAALIRRLGLRSAIGIPLMVSGEVSAILEMFTTEKRTPNGAWLQLASTFGQQIGHFIERINAEQELSDALQRLRRLLNVTDAALAHLSLNELIDDMLARICEAVAADMGVVLLANDQRQDLEVVASAGTTPKFEHGTRVHFGSYLSGRAAAERTVVTARHLSTDPSAHAGVRALGVESLAAVPLISGKRLVGVLTVGSFADKDFQRDQIDLLQLVAQRLANAIVNSSLYENARESIRSKDRFLSVASHELRAPITGILGWIEMLRTENDPAIRAEALEWIEKSARTQAMLIEDLLDATRIREGKLTLRSESVDLREVVQNAIHIVENQARERGVVLEAKLPNEAVEMWGDRMRLQQVVWNLLGNAVKFTPSGKRVRAILEADSSSRAKIVVADEGEGINAEFLPHVFEAFEQDTTGKRAGGLGLGLHIVATIVSMHGGTIDAKSDGAGKGAMFTVTLPLGR